jgi:hypothetical protein
MLRLRILGGEGEAKSKDNGGAENRAVLNTEARPYNGDGFRPKACATSS